MGTYTENIRLYEPGHRPPRLVAIGGGHGLSAMLRGLKRYTRDITAIVTVADDGGGSGRGLCSGAPYIRCRQELQCSSVAPFFVLE